MLQDRHATDKLFDHIITLTNDMDPVLAQIDQLLDDEALYQLIKADFAQRYPQTERTGRPSTPVEVLLRMLAVKRLYGLRYEETEYQVRDSLVLRRFCRVYLNAVPDDTTLIRWAKLIQPATLEQFNQRLTELATALKVTQGRKLRTDGTVVESNIHPPGDSSLLADSVRVLGRTLQRARAVLAESHTLAKATFRNRTRSARRAARQAREHLGQGGAGGQTRGAEAYQRLVNITQATLSQAETVLQALVENATPAAQRLQQTLETFLPRAEQVIDQTVRRVFQGEQVPASDKIVSIFEPHTAIIRRGKPKRPTEYGHKVWLDEVDGGIVSHYRVLAGNPSDTEQWRPSLDHHVAQFGKPPDWASADRGVYSQLNEVYAHETGVKRVILPKPGYKSKDRRDYEQQPWFRRGRRWHAGVEGRVSVLKRTCDLDRCLDHGPAGFDRWIGWGIIAGNLTVMGRALVAKSA